MAKVKLNKSDIADIKKSLNKAADFISSKQGARVDLKQERIFVKGGPFLHQATEGMTEEESARFERDNPELFAYLRAMDEQIKGMF
jgi:hypothetical protein